MSIDEYEALKESIKSQGQHLPIIVNTNLEILDGHHRFRVCEELELEPKYEIKEFSSPLHEQLFVIDCNLQRRQLTPYIRGILALKSKPILEEIARNNSNANLKQNDGYGPTGKYLPLGNGRVNDQVGERARLSRDTIRKVEFIQVNATEVVKQKLIEGKTSIHKEYRKIQIQQKKEELRNEIPRIDLREGIRLFNLDFRNLGPDIIPDNSVDLIFTDSPYGAEYLDLYNNLGNFANRVLKDGGSLVTFIGQHNMIEIGNLVENAGLNYVWPICVKHSSHFAKARLSGTTISIAWKPLLWFVKGDKSNSPGWLVDYIESTPTDKIAHPWQQSTSEAEHLIKAFTVENQIIVDPLMGSATTGVAAMKLNRKFIGIEIDKILYDNAVKRVDGKIRTILSANSAELLTRLRKGPVGCAHLVLKRLVKMLMTSNSYPILYSFILLD